jgi:DNA polymerase-3 subunit epsilon
MRTRLGLGAVILGIGGLVVMAALEGRPAGLGGAAAIAILALIGVAGGIALATQVRGWRLRVEALRGWVNLVAGQGDLARREVAPEAHAVDRVQLAIIDMIGMRMDQQSAIYRRLEEVLNALPDGVAVVTQEGLISLVNTAGRPLFGTEDRVIGKSVFETLSRESVGAAIARARAAGRPVAAEIATVWSGTVFATVSATVALIGEEGSALLRYPAAEAASLRGEHDLSLHDRPAPAAAADPETPLASLPALALDTETTGLNPRADRVISVGGIRLHGTRLYRSSILNLLVNPGRTIPNRTIAVHGISNSMVTGAPPFAAVADEVAAATDGLVMVGHHIGFDVQMLRGEMRLCGRDWMPRHCLDVMLLYAGLFPERPDLLLDDIAVALQVPVIGRHSALGDALTTAEIFARLVPVLIERGVVTLAAAEALQDQAAQRLNRLGSRGRGLRGAVP